MNWGMFFTLCWIEASIGIAIGGPRFMSNRTRRHYDEHR